MMILSAVVLMGAAPPSGVVRAHAAMDLSPFAGPGVTNVSVTVEPALLDGSHATAGAFVLNDPRYPGAIPPDDPTFFAAADALGPAIVRVGDASAGTVVGWDNATESWSLNFANLTREIAFAHSLGAEVFLSFPAGTWGDGNTLPTDSPLNTTIPVETVARGANVTGFFPADAAWRALVGQMVDYAVDTSAGVLYWNIGNEVPLVNASVVAEYTHLFNLAAAIIHAQLPNALVGSDVMMNKQYDDYFATHADGVGFLSFHWYPAYAGCPSPDSYCPPTNASGYWSTSNLMNETGWRDLPFVAPSVAQSEWFAATGAHLPVLDSESNLNSYYASGTDPRQQSLVASAWLISSLILGSRTNLSALTWFDLEGGVCATSLSAAYGGWGYGLMAPERGGNNTFYAPYWALELWDRYFPADAPGLVTNVSESDAASAYAVRVGENISVAVVNRYATDVSFNVSLGGGGWTSSGVDFLDNSTYREVWNVSTQHEELVRSSVGFAPSTGGSERFTLGGYGIAVAQFVSSGSTGTNGTGNSTGSGNSTGNATGSNGGNSTGNSTGSGADNSTGSSTGTGNATGTAPTTGNSTPVTPPGGSSGGGTGAGTGGSSVPSTVVPILTVAGLLVLGAGAGSLAGLRRRRAPGYRPTYR
jgi:hypothetical protein